MTRNYNYLWEKAMRNKYVQYCQVYKWKVFETMVVGENTNNYSNVEILSLFYLYGKKHKTICRTTICRELYPDLVPVNNKKCRRF